MAGPLNTLPGHVILSPAQQALLARRLRGEQPSSTARITRRADRSTAPLSFTQEGQWLFEQLYPASGLFNVFQAIRLRFPVDRALLEHSVNLVASRHDVLRTTFRVVRGTPMQVIAPHVAITVNTIDLSALTTDERDVRLRAWVAEEARAAFNLADGPLLRVRLVRLAEADHFVTVCVHHIAADGRSLDILTRETIAAYRALQRGQVPSFAELAVQYGDYTAWQRARIGASAMDRQLAFWRDHLVDAPRAANLPTDRRQPAARNFSGGHCELRLPQELADKLRALCRHEQVTLFMVLLAGFAATIHRWSGLNDVVIGSPVANRSHRELEGLIGLFINIVAFRIDLSSDPTVAELLARIRSEATAVYANQDVPFERVIDALGVKREGRHAPLFQVMLALQPPSAAREGTSLETQHFPEAAAGAKFDLTLALGEVANGPIVGTLEFAAELFERATAEQFVRQFETLLQEMAQSPGLRLSQLSLLRPAEFRQVIETWNATGRPVPADCLHDLVSRQAALTPDSIAVVFDRLHLTYASLEARSNRLARHLQSLGVGPDSIVGLCVDRSELLVIGLLGILKAGGAYLPLDPDYPTERLAFMLDDAGSSLVVTQADLIGRLPSPRALHAVCLDRDDGAIAACSAAPVHASGHPLNAAYVLYTSGSTGRPKGVLGTHRALVNRVLQDYLPEQPHAVYAQKTTPNFIDVLWEIFMPLVRGQRVVIVPASATRVPELLVELLAREGVTRTVLVPSLLRAIVEGTADLARRLARLEYWSCSGETLRPLLAQAFRAQLPDALLLNIYGTSEFWDATWTASHGDDGRSGTQIGGLLSNMQAYILDAMLAPLPVRLPGELYVGGAGLARGYLGRPGLTAERFVPHPYASGERLYRSLDLARWQADGTLEFLGRRDHQVKLRGFRIELGEIETVLAAAGRVQQAVAMVREDVPDEPVLVAYVRGDERTLDEDELKAVLRGKVPDHMVPARIIVLDRIPLAPNGKIDRGSLPPPRRAGQRRRTRTAALGNTERQLLAIWRDVLPIDGFGVEDKFFDLGGHSLLLVEVQSMLAERMGRFVPIVHLLQYPTVRLLAAHLAASGGEVAAGQSA